MLHIKSFDPSPSDGVSPVGRQYHYHDQHDSTSVEISDIWSWLHSNSKCGKVLLIDDAVQQEQQAVIGAAAEDSQQIAESRFCLFGSEGEAKGALNGSEKSGLIITLETPEEADCSAMLLVRVYRLNLPSVGSERIHDRLVTVYSLKASWDGDRLPSIAEFKKQICNRIFRSATSMSDDGSEKEEMLIVDMFQRGVPANGINSADATGSVSPPVRPSMLISLDFMVESKSNANAMRIKGNGNEESLLQTQDCSSYLADISAALGCCLSAAQQVFLTRLAGSIMRDISGLGSQSHSVAERSSFESFVAHTARSSSGHSSSVSRCIAADGDPRLRVKAAPTPEEGVSVLEFFSGIGGMRLALPNSIRGTPIRDIQAYDCSETANDVYAANFDAGQAGGAPSGLPVLGPKHTTGKLNRLLIDGLKLCEVEGKADLWTMSPPCQPYTTTKGAHRLDGKDNRSRAFLHLMSLLRQMEQRPRWIVLENVQGFLHSDVLRYWKTVLRDCGYVWRQYLLSPVSSVGLPNHRMRYYMVAEYSLPGVASFVDCIPSGGGGDLAADELQLEEGEEEDAEQGAEEEEEEEDGIDDIDGRGDRDNEVGESVPFELPSEVEEGESAEELFTSLPPHISSRYPETPSPIGAFVLPREEIPAEDLEFLVLPPSALSACWAANRLSIVGQHCRRSYCFTHSYGRLYDKSSGSLYFENALGPLSEEGYRVDRTRLPSYLGAIRRFHPDELLAISGFPQGFQWPRNLTLEKRCGCVGNSVNVAVVRCVMQVLFGMEGGEA